MKDNISGIEIKYIKRRLSEGFSSTAEIQSNGFIQMWLLFHGGGLTGDKEVFINGNYGVGFVGDKLLREV